LYQNKGELNKLDILYRRIKEIDSENQIPEKYYDTIKGKHNDSGFIDDTVSEKKVDVTPLADDIIEQNLPENNYLDDEPKPFLFYFHNKVGPKPNLEQEEELLKRVDISTIEKRTKEVKTFVTSRFTEGLRNHYKYILASFLLILLGISLYFYKGKNEHQNIIIKAKEIAQQTSNFEVTVMKLTDINELKGKIDENNRRENLFYSLSVRAKKSCIDDLFVSSPFSLISFIDQNGNQFKVKDIKELHGLTRIIYRTNICNKNAGAIFVKVIFAHDRKFDYAGISLAGLEKDRPILIKWD